MSSDRRMVHHYLNLRPANDEVEATGVVEATKKDYDGCSIGDDERSESGPFPIQRTSSPRPSPDPTLDTRL